MANVGHPPDKTAIIANGLNFEYLWVKNSSKFLDNSWTAYCETPDGKPMQFMSRENRAWGLFPKDKPLSELHELRKFEERWPKSGIRKGQIFQVLPAAAEHPELKDFGNEDDLLIYNVNYWSDTVEIHVNADEQLSIVVLVSELLKLAKPYMTLVSDSFSIAVKRGAPRLLGEMLRDFPTTSLIEYMLKGHVQCNITVYENHKAEGYGRELFYKEMENFNVGQFKEIANEKKKCRDLLLSDGRKIGLINTTPKTDTALLLAAYTGKVILMKTQQPDGIADIPMRVRNEISPYLTQTGSQLKALANRYETCCNPLFLTLLGMGIWKRLPATETTSIAQPQAMSQPA